MGGDRESERWAKIGKDSLKRVEEGILQYNTGGWQNFKSLLPGKYFEYDTTKVYQSVGSTLRPPADGTTISD